MVSFLADFLILTFLRVSVILVFAVVGFMMLTFTVFVEPEYVSSATNVITAL